MGNMLRSDSVYLDSNPIGVRNGFHRSKVQPWLSLFGRLGDRNTGLSHFDDYLYGNRFRGGGGIVRLKAESHNCKTTFVNGVNIFQPKKRVVKLHGEILSVLSDGKPRGITEVMEAVGYDSYGYVAGTLARMAQNKLIKKESVTRAGGGPTPLYSIWDAP